MDFSLVFSQKNLPGSFTEDPSQAFLTYELIPRNDFISPSNQLSYHIGTTFLLRLKNDWQITAQLEFFKRELGTYGFSLRTNTTSNHRIFYGRDSALGIGCKGKLGGIYTYNLVCVY